MFTVILWIILSFVVGALGDGRKITAVGALVLSLILSPVIGFIFTVLSDKKIPISICKHCQQKNVATAVYCSRCGRDKEGYTIEENKLRFPVKH